MRIGILGAGQLGQMLGFAANQLGHECRFLDPAENPPAADAGSLSQAAYDDVAAIEKLASETDVLTYEFENVPVDALEALPSSVRIYPPLEALRQAQDRLIEKRLFEELDIPLPPYRKIDSYEDLVSASCSLGYPIVLKTRRFGYDGKGQWVVRNDSDRQQAWDDIGGKPLIAESWVSFSHEVSIIGARGTDGAVVTWPLTRNSHRDGILRTSLAPEADAPLTATAEDYMRRLLDRLDYVGVLALELFVSDGGLLANEFAPRVHNSGHWTIEGSTTSQFANHIRAVAGESLGAANCRGFAGMVNLIGSISNATRSFEHNGVFFHDYGKSPRPARKLGHVTVVAETARARDQLIAKIVKNVT